VRGGFFGVVVVGVFDLCHQFVQLVIGVFDGVLLVFCTELGELGCFGVLVGDEVGGEGVVFDVG